MPSTSKRRRKFSVRNKNEKRNTPKNQSEISRKIETDVNAQIAAETNNFKCKTAANSSKIVTALCDNATSITEILGERIDEDISLNSVIVTLNNSSADHTNERCGATPINRERTRIRRERHPRQHRIKVRSPKRSLIIHEQVKPTDSTYNLCKIRTIGTNAINWEEELAIFNAENITETEYTENEEIPSDHSSDDMCRICHGGDSLSFDLGRLISTCGCRGTVGRVHVKCLERWLTESGKTRCELCGTRYATRRVHRYGVPRALVMWILSRNAKQLMVDSLGIMLMSPLAILAAWLSGRTLAGLMTQESHVTPWPLASTFVLACMTLVCYYCWIVSAATRHALGWWIWYRSQYEVRLQIQENEE